MTDLTNDDAPVFALVDDHMYSARLFTRILRDTDAVAQVKWLGDATHAFRALEIQLANASGETPDLIIVDLKSHTGANEDFVSRISSHARAAGVPVAVIASGLDEHHQRRLLAAGADAAFERHHERNAYRREVARLSDFWVRETGTWPIRA